MKLLLLLIRTRPAEWTALNAPPMSDAEQMNPDQPVEALLAFQSRTK
jgi:hypothetical protein